MGMSTHVVGFRPADEKWSKMKAVYEACEAADTAIPKEVLSFFGENHPNDGPGIPVDLENSEAVKEWKGDGESGFDIEIDKLPLNVSVIRVYNAW